MMHDCIIIFGFSGSGKSTVANAIAKRSGLRVIHPSGILRNLYAGKRVDLRRTTYNRGFWESKKGVALFKSRLTEDQPLDLVSDEILLREVKKGNVVIDSWSLPWLSNQGIKVYLKAPLKERAKRVAKRGRIPYREALNIVKMKDECTRRLFKRLYGFDIKKDTYVFDLVIDTVRTPRQQVAQKIITFSGNLLPSKILTSRKFTTRARRA